MTMSPSNINLRVDLKIKCFIQLAKKLVVDSIETEIAKTDNEEMKDALINKLGEILESDIKFIKTQMYNTYQQRTPPSVPVLVRGTHLKLKNISSVPKYRAFCTKIADMLNYASDFSNAPFNNLPKNARIYEALKTLSRERNLTQEELDKIVEECENEH